jgi:hypothetical protein
LAGDLAEKHSLRGFDSIHLASALTLQRQLASSVKAWLKVSFFLDYFRGQRGIVIMIKKDIQTYMDRWKLVYKVEEQEMRDASFELLLQQTFTIWDIGKSLRFLNYDKPINPLWMQLQCKWKEQHV